MRLTKLDNGQYRMKMNCKLGIFTFVGTESECWEKARYLENLYKEG